MISAGVEGRLPYMTYPEPWRGPPKQPPELFLRPAPKPLPPSTRYNGVNTTTYPNGTRLAPAPSTITKYPSPPSIPAPVNLTQKEVTEEMPTYSPYRLFSHPPQFPHFAYPVCQPPYMMRTNFPATPLSPMETFSPTTPTTTTFLSPPSTFSPPSSLKTGQSLLREKKLPQQSVVTSTLPTSPSTQSGAFKVPSGKEGSLKHRILTRPEEIRSGPLDLQKPPEGRKRLQATMSPPRSPKKTLNNNTLPSNFAKGSLIQLFNGELRRIEDMRTEDFIISAERSPELRLAESTVLKIDENPQTENATITLTYNNRRAQVGVESRAEHPYFVMGHGWASCNPDRTQQCYGLKVHRLRVGDVLISLTPRETPTTSCPSTRSGTRAGTTIITTATTTSMTARQQSVNSVVKTHLSEPKVCINQTQPMNLHQPSSRPPQSLSPESLAARKRRWSAPDQICEEEVINRKRQRVE
ncbi:ataxin 1 isoform X2 [Leptinotarsa decemlineata]|uniref:ataxin 1 isoform X2 n=1 Tax=Leptinotarsa decemlineata TaxID=7539 RepID=UPI003D30BB90